MNTFSSAWRALLCAAAFVAACGPAFAETAAARLVSADSRIVFVTRQMGVPVEGEFRKFEATIAFDPRQPEGGTVALQVDLASATLGVPQSDAELPKAAWFDTARFPRATFASTQIQALGEGRFEIAGKLTIKGTTQALRVPVAITQAAGHSVASGSLGIRRLAFKVGDGEWTDTSVVADDVQVRFKLVLTGFGPL